MPGVNFRNKDFLRLDTVRSYATSINTLFKLRDMKPPVNVADPNNIFGILINNLVKEEDIARQCSPLGSDIFTELLCKSNVSRSRDSKHSSLFNLVVIGCYIGPCMSKYAQTSDKNMDYHVYPSGKQVIKVFIASNFTFYDKKSQIIADLSNALFDTVERVRITWRIQKNCQNNQKITLLYDKANKAICPVLATLHLVLRARCFSQPDSMPVACYSKKDSLAYIIGIRIAVLFRAVARAVRPTITVGRDADTAQIVFVCSFVNTTSLCLTLTGIVITMIARRRCRFHLSVGVYFKEVSYFSNAVRLLAIP